MLTLRYPFLCAKILCMATVGIQQTQAGLSNRDLLACCSSTSMERRALCAAVLENTAQSILFYRNLLDRKDVYLDICFPEDLSSDALIETYVAWIKSHENLLDDAAFLGATSAISTKYSCKKPLNSLKTFKQKPSSSLK